MQIDTISIEGYKSFAKIDQFALGNLNVLIGANGAGKSNFLSLFRLLTALSQGNLQTFVKGQGGPDALLHGGRKRTPQLKVELQFARNGDVVNGYALTLAATADNRLQFLREEPWIIGRRTGTAPKRYPLGQAHEEAKVIADPNPVSGYVAKWMKHWQQFHFHDTSEGAAAEREGVRSLFVEEGEAIRQMLQQLEAAERQPALQGFIRSLLSIWPGHSVRKAAEGLEEELTEREREVVCLAAKGMSNDEIGKQLSLALGTVKWHLHNIYEKLKVRNRTQAIRRVRELSLLEP